MGARAKTNHFLQVATTVQMILQIRRSMAEQNMHSTYEDLLPLVCSWISSPLGLTVKILQSGTPTSL